jgi:hypothetical protein
MDGVAPSDSKVGLFDFWPDWGAPVFHEAYGHHKRGNDCERGEDWQCSLNAVEANPHITQVLSVTLVRQFECERVYMSLSARHFQVRKVLARCVR